jgi:hypothetical protein
VNRARQVNRLRSITRRVLTKIAAYGLVVPSVLAACTGGGSGTAPGGAASSSGSSGTAQCTYKEKGTEFADCKDDGDCFSGYCHKTCTPAPCCQNPNTTAMKAGRGYSCKTDQECAAVASDFISRGGKATCRYDNLNSISNGCSFNCLPGSGGTSSGAGTSGTSGSTSGGTSGTSGSSGDATCTTPPVFNCGTSAAGTLPCAQGSVCCLSPGCPTAADPYTANGSVSRCAAPVAASGTSDQCAAPALQLCATTADCGPNYTCDPAKYYCIPGQ